MGTIQSLQCTAIFEWRTELATMDRLFDPDLNPGANRLGEAWIAVRDRLKIEAPAAWYERFIYPIRPLGIEDENVHLGVPGKFVSEWIRDKYLRTLEAMLSDEFGRPVRVVLVTETRERSTRESPTFAVSTPTTAARRFEPVERFTFDKFVEGPSNRLAVAGAQAVANDPGRKYNPLFIYGPSGLGKTHLLHAIAHEIMRRDPKAVVEYVSAQQFAQDFVDSLKANRVDQFRRAQRGVTAWLVDDIQFVAGKDRTQEEVFHTFNQLQASGRQIVLTADRSPRDLYMMDERMRSRFEAGLVADVQMPDTETRWAIVRAKAEREGLDLSHDVAMVLAENVPGNIRTLEGAFTKLVATASVQQLEITPEFALSIVDKHYRSSIIAKPSIDQIVNEVGKHYSIEHGDIKGASRRAPVVHARHMAIYIARQLTQDSWKHIGDSFGGRDHSTIMHGYQRVTEMIQTDKDLRAIVKMLMRNLYPESQL